MCATTHIDLMLRAKQDKIKVEIIHNASIISAIGITGLEVYKFGKTTSIPFHNENVKSPIEVLNNNNKNKLHTLLLLDLDPINNKFMTIKDAIDYLVKNYILLSIFRKIPHRLSQQQQPKNYIGILSPSLFLFSFLLDLYLKQYRR